MKEEAAHNVPLYQSAGGEKRVGINLPYGRHMLPVEIPEEYLGEMVIPHRTDTTADPIATIRSALSHPIGTLCLEQLVQPYNPRSE